MTGAYSNHYNTVDDVGLDLNNHQIRLIVFAVVMAVVVVLVEIVRIVQFPSLQVTEIHIQLCFLQMCFVIDAFLSEDEILPLNPSDDNSDCIAMSLFLHYFFLAQFMWMATQVKACMLIFMQRLM